MPLKPFNELVKIDLVKEGHTFKKPTFIKKREGRETKYVKAPEDQWLDYCEWAKIIELLYEHGAKKVRYGVKRNEDGYPAFFNQGIAPFVVVWVDIDDDKFELDFPVMGKASSTGGQVSSLVVHIAHQRGFAKCVAINTGLGLSLWMKDEQAQVDDPEEDQSKSEQITAKNKQIIELTEKLVKKCGNTAMFYSLIQSSKRELKKVMDSESDKDKNELIQLLEQWASLDANTLEAEINKRKK